MSSLVILQPQPAETALNFIGGTVVNNPSTGTIDIATAAGIPGQRARCTNSTSQIITTGVNQPLVFDTNVYDTSGIHSTTVNNSRFTIPAGLGGIWLALGQVAWQTSVTAGQRGIGISRNGLVNNPEALTFAYGETFSVYQQVVNVMVLADGEYVQFDVWNGTGGDLNALAASFGLLIRLL